MGVALVVVFVALVLLAVVAVVVAVASVAAEREERERLELKLDHAKTMAREERGHDEIMSYVEEDSRTDDDDGIDR